MNTNNQNSFKKGALTPKDLYTKQQKLIEEITETYDVKEACICAGFNEMGVRLVLKSKVHLFKEDYKNNLEKALEWCLFYKINDVELFLYREPD